MYQIIARKYRPQKFSSVLGQEAIVSTLKNALRQQKLAHAYLFSGSKGTGKTTLARLFAKALNCQQLSEEQEPCNQCPSCLAIASGHSLDVLEIDGASNRGIDDIRQINETVGYAPSSSKYKIYLIDEVHMLTKEAFNALLKTLEEPPPNVKFFFATTEPQKVLPTIISRCQRFDLNRISSEAVIKKLSHISVDLGLEVELSALELLAKIGEGSLRDAESLFDQVICYASKQEINAETVAKALGLPSSTLFRGLDEAIQEGRLPFSIELVEHLFANGKDLGYFMEALMEHFRSHLMCSLQEEKQGIYSTEQCLYILDFLLSWSQKLNKTPFKRICLEIILLHLIRSRHRVSYDSLVERLVGMEKALSKETIPLQKKPVEPEEPKMPIQELPPSEKQPPLIQQPFSAAPSVKYDTLLRFAAVELEGIIKK